MTNVEQCALWRQRLAAQQGSGRTVVAWCLQQGINKKACYYWSKRFLMFGKTLVFTAMQWLALAPEADSAFMLMIQVGPVNYYR